MKTARKTANSIVVTKEGGQRNVYVLVDADGVVSIYDGINYVDDEGESLVDEYNPINNLYTSNTGMSWSNELVLEDGTGMKFEFNLHGLVNQYGLNCYIARGFNYNDGVTNIYKPIFVLEYENYVVITDVSHFVEAFVTIKSLRRSEDEWKTFTLGDTTVRYINYTYTSVDIGKYTTTYRENKKYIGNMRHIVNNLYISHINLRFVTVDKYYNIISDEYNIFDVKGLKGFIARTIYDHLVFEVKGEDGFTVVHTEYSPVIDGHVFTHMSTISEVDFVLGKLSEHGESYYRFDYLAYVVAVTDNYSYVVSSIANDYELYRAKPNYRNGKVGNLVVMDDNYEKVVKGAVRTKLANVPDLNVLSMGSISEDIMSVHEFYMAYDRYLKIVQ